MMTVFVRLLHTPVVQHGRTPRPGHPLPQCPVQPPTNSRVTPNLQAASGPCTLLKRQLSILVPDKQFRFNPYSESSGTRQYHQQVWKRTVTQQKKSGNKWSLLLILIIIAALALLFFAFSEMNLLPIDSDQNQSEQFTPPPPPDSPPSDSPSGQSVPTPPDGPPGSSDLPTPPSNPPSSPPD